MRATDLTQFDPIYRASLPPVLRALMDLESVTDRQGRGIELATKGYLIDKAIMVDGDDAFKMMDLRYNFGFTWVPSLFGAVITVAPGLGGLPGAAPYDPAHPQFNAIKVSLEIGDGKTTFGDYPPFEPPKPVTPAPEKVSPVGVSEGFGWSPAGQVEYFSAISAVVRSLGLFDGQKYTEPDQPGRPSRGSFTLHESGDPFALGTGQVAMWFTKNPA